MKILVIFTGGTIGSTVSGDYISTDGNKPYVILEKYNSQYPNEIEWDTVSPYTILSENVTCKTYGMLYNEVKEALDKEYDGIIITHGSDTLQYSAAFLSLVLGSDIVPVMLVSSNYVLEDERANGMDNFRCAVDFIQNKRGRGVFVPYRNDGEGCKIHLPSKVLAHNSYSDDLFSIGGGYFGIYNGDTFSYGSDCERECETALEPKVDFDKEGTGILKLSMHPGMIYPKDLSEIKVVLIQAYHGGTLCVESKEFQNFVKKAKEKDILVYLVGANNETEYDSCKVYESIGITVLPKVSPIYAYMRLWLANIW